MIRVLLSLIVFIPAVSMAMSAPYFQNPENQNKLPVRLGKQMESTYRTRVRPIFVKEGPRTRQQRYVQTPVVRRQQSGRNQLVAYRPSQSTYRQVVDPSPSYKAPVTEVFSAPVQQAQTLGQRVVRKVQTPAKGAQQASCFDSYTEEECEAVRLTNKYRASHGLSQLKIDLECSQLAEQSAEYNQVHHGQSGQISHSHFMKLVSNLIGNYAENLYWGSGPSVTRPEDAVKGWIESPSHNENLLQPGHQYIGIVKHGGVWAQCFRSDI